MRSTSSSSGRRSSSAERGSSSRRRGTVQPAGRDARGAAADQRRTRAAGRALQRLVAGRARRRRTDRRCSPSAPACRCHRASRPGSAAAARRLEGPRRAPRRSRASTSSTCTIRSRRAPRRLRSATRARSTSAAFTSRRSGCSRRRSPDPSSRSSSGDSTRGRRAAARRRTSCAATSRAATSSSSLGCARSRASGPGELASRTRGPLRIAYCLEEERGALRLFLRALRRLPADLKWEAAIWLPDGGDVRICKPLARPHPVRGAASDRARGAGRCRRRSSASRLAGRARRRG